jgi:signal transduction histidine kinase
MAEKPGGRDGQEQGSGRRERSPRGGTSSSDVGQSGGDAMKLSSFLATHREQVLTAWEQQAAKRVPRLASVDRLRDHLGELLDVIASDLESADRADHIAEELNDRASKNVEVIAEKHAAGRAHQGLSLKEMVREFPVLRSCVLRHWLGSQSCSSPEDLDDLLRFDESLDIALTQAVSAFMDRLNRSREIFLSILAHDLRNPLSTIITGSTLLRDERLDAASSREMLALIASTSERMHGLVDDLLDFTRTRLGGQLPIERHESDLTRTVRNVVGEFATSHPDRAVNVRISGDLKGSWDEGRIGQAVGNLLGNAVDHGAKDSPIDLLARADDREVKITVHNEGPPIPAEERAHLFQPLRRFSVRDVKRRHPKHLGLGLYIARAIAVGHGGRIEVDSSAERGTTFTMRLPRRHENSA